MSFLSCLNHPTLVVASVGGISLGVTLLLLPWKTMTLGSPSFSQLSSAQPKENCTIVDSFNDTFEIEKTNNEDYYLISCNHKKIKKSWENVFPDKWQGLFPKSIFKDQHWNKNKKLEIKVEEDMGEISTVSLTGDEIYPFKITFSSEQFINVNNFLLTGKWNYKDFVGGEEKKSGVIVKLTNLKDIQDIYLLLDSYNR